MFPAFIETVVETSRGTNELHAETTRQLKKVRDAAHLQVLVTPSCNHSPNVARTAFRLAQQNNRVTADVIEVMEFPQFVERYGVQATPSVIINETLVLAGAMEEATLVDCLLRAVEGKPVEPGPFGPTNLLAPPQAQQEVRTSASGLIIPR
jgi:alkyl hydroperoxide reductase subunit AhpF